MKANEKRGMVAEQEELPDLSDAFLKMPSLLPGNSAATY